MPMHRTTLVALAAGMALAGHARAERLGLDEALAYAAARNPELAAVHSQAEAAASARSAAAAGLLPQLNFGYSARYSDNPLDAFADKLNTRSVTAADFDPARLNNPDSTTLHATELLAAWPLYTGGRTQATIRESEHNEAAARSGYSRARELTAFRVRSAYFGAQAAAEGVHIAEDAVAASRLHADTTARLLRERRIVPSDNLTADVNHALWRSAREQAQTRATNALNQLKLAMGAPLDADLEPLSWQDPAPGAAPEPVTVFEQRALANRSDLKAQQAQVAAARSRIEQARAGLKPRFDLVASESWYDDQPSLDNESTRLMGVFSMNLWSGGRDQHQIAAAARLAEEQEKRLESLQQQARAEVRAAHQALIEARSRVEICADNIGKARRTVELVRGRYGEGRTILIDLLQAERALVDARQEKLAASLNYLVAEAQLRLATGETGTAQ
jgi:outer membrane protein TolC